MQMDEGLDTDKITSLNVLFSQMKQHKVDRLATFGADALLHANNHLSEMQHQAKCFIGYLCA